MADEICVGAAVWICAVAVGIYAAAAVRGRRREGHAGRRGLVPVH
jgi:F0F1-type ATP synthase membrane subunit c/vacuolar-type H+-ATPase subunit K